MSTGLDASGPIPGYYDSPWPAECGGPRRQKAPRSPGLALGPGTRLVQHTRTNGEWNVMMVLRAPGEVFLQYNNPIGAPESYAVIERIHPETLEPLAASPRLPSGGHTWCGGIVAHANGFLYFNNGDRCYKLDRECNVLAARTLPRASAYNSLLVMADGSLVMKNMERDAGYDSAFVVLEPDRLEQVGPEVVVPERTMGRIAMDTTAAGQFVYVPGTHHFYRYRYADRTLTLDAAWQPRYRALPDDQQQFSWDSCLSGGACWMQDNGDNGANVTIFSTRPFGQRLPERGSVFKGLASSPQKLIRIALDDASDIAVLEPFGLPRGNIFSPPAFDPTRNVAITFDTGNGQLGGFRYLGAGRFEPLWRVACRISMQLVLFLDTGEVAVNDFRDGCDHVVVFDVESGREKGRVATGSRTANGMFLSTGWNRDVYYCSIGAIARVAVA